MAQDAYLERELEKVLEAEKKLGWSNYHFYEAVAILSLLGSVGASVLAAIGGEKILTALLAAIPATVLAITKIFLSSLVLSLTGENSSESTGYCYG